MSRPDDDRGAGRARAFYDRHSALFETHAGPTIQSGLFCVGPGGHEDPAASNRELARRAGLRPGERVLDAGCGLCGPALDIAAAWPDVQIDALTISPVQVARSRERIQAVALQDRVRVHEGDYHALPFADGTFDLVWYFESTGYSHDLPRLFAEAARVLRPGGRLYVKDAWRDEEPLGAQARIDLDRFDVVWAARTPSRSETRAALEGAGLRVEHMALIADQVGFDHMRGAMFDWRTDGRFAVNAYGERFMPDYTELPILMGEALARKPG